MAEVKPPANLAPYVEALGEADAFKLFIELGGSELYLPSKSTARSKAAQVLGAEKVDKLARHIGSGYIKIPVARRWIADVMYERGETLAEITRTVRADYSTVRRWFSGSSREDQLDLF